MTDKELHKLGRKELLQLLVAQSREADTARQKLAETQEELGQLQETYERLRGRLDDKDAQIRKLREIIRQERQAQGLPADGAVPEEQTGPLPPRQPEPYPRTAFPPPSGYGAVPPARGYERFYSEPPYAPYVERPAPAQSRAYAPVPEPAPAQSQAYAPLPEPAPAQSQAYASPPEPAAAYPYRQPQPEASWQQPEASRQQRTPYSQYPAYPAPEAPASRAPVPSYDRGEASGPVGYSPETGGYPVLSQPYSPPEEGPKAPSVPPPGARSPEAEKRKGRGRETPGKFPESLVNPLSLPVVGTLRGPSDPLKGEGPPSLSEEPASPEKPWWQPSAPRHAGPSGKPPAHQAQGKKQAAEAPVPLPRPAPKAPVPRQPQPPPKPKAPAQKEDVQVLRVVNGKIVELG